MDRASRDVTLLTRSRRDEGNAVFSPDGQMIAFDRCCFGPDNTRAIFVMNADGTALKRLTGGTDASDPNWQPLSG
jgi:Tol biopolymer transport system component